MFILQSVAITGILALGVTATLVVDGFDLSIGAVATSAMMLSAYVMVIWEMGALTAVSFVAAEAEFTPNTVQTEDQRTTLVFEVRIRVDDPDSLRAGMPADVTFA